MRWLREFAKKTLPKPFVEWYRRRRATKHYLRALGYEIYDRGIRMEIDDLEGRIAARRDGFYDHLVKDVLERTELILQELDRKIEGVTARHGAELRELRIELVDLRTAIRALPPPGPNGGASTPTTPTTPTASTPTASTPTASTPTAGAPAPSQAAAAPAPAPASSPAER